MTTSTNEFSTDPSKQINEWAVAAGRLLQSPQTGFVHYYYGESAQSMHQTIPILENALFALALLRSRLVENAQEGIGLMKRLLVFQNQQQENSRGNFPVYLHDYPTCYDPSLGLQLLAPFYWIIKQFGHVLSPEFKKQLEQASHQILEYSLAAHTAKAFPYFLSIRLAAAQWAFGKLWGKSDWEKGGEEQLEQLAERQLEGWTTTKQLGDLLPGLQMVYPSLLNSPWSPLWHRMEQTWHCQTGSYIGPCMREWEEGEESQPNLYDLYGGYFSGKFSRRAAVLKAYHLHGAMMQSTADKFAPLPPPYILKGMFREQPWETQCQPACAWTGLEKIHPLDPSVEKTFTPFRYIWGDLDRTHSFVCQGGRYEKAVCQMDEEKVVLDFDLGDAITSEEQGREIEFFVDVGSGAKFSVDGKASNTFAIGQTIDIACEQQRLALIFQLMEGEGDFIVHVMRGNRPSQVDLKGENRFQSFDWTLFLRTVRRKGSCRFRVKIFVPIN